MKELLNLSIKLFLPRKLYSIKLYEGGNMVDHITKIYPTHDKLTANGKSINEQHLATVLLCSLPSSNEL